MKRVLFALALIACCGTASAKQNSFLSIVKTTPEVYRPGWPPGLWVTLEDWGLYGPVLEVVATQEGGLIRRETLKFDEQGRLLFRGVDTSYLSSEDHYSYKGDRLVETLRVYENGEIVRSNYRYDARGYLTSEMNTTTTDVSRLEKFRTEKFPDATDLNRKFIEKARTEGPAVSEVIYEYGSSGLIKIKKCARKSANASCPSESLDYEAAGRTTSEPAERARYTYDQHRNWILREALPALTETPEVSRRKIRYR